MLIFQKIDIYHYPHIRYLFKIVVNICLSNKIANLFLNNLFSRVYEATNLCIKYSNDVLNDGPFVNVSSEDKRFL